MAKEEAKDIHWHIQSWANSWELKVILSEGKDRTLMQSIAS